MLYGVGGVFGGSTFYVVMGDILKFAVAGQPP